MNINGSIVATTMEAFMASMSNTASALETRVECTGIDMFFKTKPNNLGNLTKMLKTMAIGISRDRDSREEDLNSPLSKLFKSEFNHPKGGEFCLTIKFDKPAIVCPMLVLERIRDLLEPTNLQFTGSELYLNLKA